MQDTAARRSRSTTARTAVALAAAASVLLTGAGCSSGDSDGSSSPAARSGGPHGGKQPAAKPAGPRWNTSPATVASVGDSISRGFDACSVLSDCPQVSWSTGTKVNSLAKRLRSASGGSRKAASTTSWNFAKTGARMVDLAAQIKSAVARKPDLVTVMMGANDACRKTVDEMTSAAAFRTEFTDALQALRGDLPKAQVYVASVPDLKRLWSEGRKNLLGKEIWRLGICPSMLKDPDAVDAAANARRNKVADRVNEYNAVLKKVCDEDPLCRYDSSVFDYKFSKNELSKWDNFHPDRDGQVQLADMAFEAVTKG